MYALSQFPLKKCSSRYELQYKVFAVRIHRKQQTGNRKRGRRRVPVQSSSNWLETLKRMQKTYQYFIQRWEDGTSLN